MATVKGSQRLNLSVETLHLQVTLPRFKTQKSQHVNITDEDEESIMDFIKELKELYTKKHKMKDHHLMEWLSQDTVTCRVLKVTDVRIKWEVK